MKSLTGKFASSGGWALLLILLLGAGLFVAACGDEDVPTPTTPAPPPPPPPAPPPTPEPEPEPEAPAVPVGLRISGSGTDFVEWSWTPVADVSGYDVQFSPNEAFTGEDEIIARTAEEISYRRDGLAEATSAFLRVRSAAGTGEERITSDWSTHVTGMTEAPTPEPEPVPPAMPTGLTVSDRGEDFIEWSWDPVAGAGGYDVQFSENQIFSEEDETISRSVEQVSYRREELETGTSYYLRVRSAAAGTGEERITSDWSTHVTGMTEAPTPVLQPPAMPTGLAVSERGENFIEWSWDPVAGASGYDVQFSENQVFSEEDETISRTVEEVSYRREELEAETSYYLQVRSAAGTGEERVTSGWSTHVTGTTTAAEPDASLAPANLRVKDRGSDFIEWEWDDVAGASGYQAQFSTDSAFSDPDTFFRQGASNTSTRVSNLESEADGYLRVRAYLGTLANPVFGEWSEANKATTDEAPAAVEVALDAPDNVETSDRQDNSITVAWDAVNDADEYQVQQREDGGDWVGANCGSATGSNVVTDTSCVASGLDEDTEYDFRVKAIPDSSDSTKTESGWSGTASATTTGEAPPPPIMIEDDELGLAWKSSEDEEEDPSTHTIRWDWDPVPDRAQRDRISNYTALLASGESCPDLEVAKTDGWTDMGSDISYRTTTEEGTENGTPLAEGAIAGLCVVRSWLDEREVRQFGDVSLAWASTVPYYDMDARPDVRTSDTTRLTTSITWDYRVDEGFRYELRVLSADRDDGLSDGACDGGRSAGSPSASTTDNVDLTHRETSLDPYSDYRLCVRATNDDGASAWQDVGDAITRPTAPSALRFDSGDSQTTTSDWGGQRATRLAWTVAEKAGTPRDADKYETKGFRTTNNISSGNLQDRCTSAEDQLDLAASNTGMGIALTTVHADLSNVENPAPIPLLCLRARRPRWGQQQQRRQRQ